MNVGLVKLSSLGDVVHALPVAATLRAHQADLHLTWVVEAREAVVLRDHPALDRVMAVDIRSTRRARTLSAAAGAVRALGGYAADLRRARFDVVVDLQGLLKTGVISALTGAPVRIGFSARRCREPVNACFTNRHVDPPPAARHVVDQYLALLHPLGAVQPVHEFRLPSAAAAEAAADDFFDAAGIKPSNRVVILNVGAGRPEKRWPEARFRELVTRLDEDTAASVLIVWGPGEDRLAHTIVAGLEEGRAVVAPPTSVGGLIAMLRRASVVVAADTGPLHLAAALGVPCVGLYGPTSGVRNGPFGSGHRVLQSPDGRMASIEAGAVLNAVGALLG